MKTSWPRVEVAIAVEFVATHALPGIGYSKPHEHRYSVTAGYCHEINPTLGCTKPMNAMQHDLDGVVARIAGKDLNAALPVTPTAEMLACWILANLPPYWSFVEVRAYDGFRCRIERHLMTTQWVARLQS